MSSTCYAQGVRSLLNGLPLLAIILAAPARADRVTLTNGFIVEGKASEAGVVLRG